MVEAGPAVLTSFLRSMLIDKFKIFIAPKIIGGDSSFDMFGKTGTDKVKDSIKLEFDSFNKSGDDILITAYPAKNTGGMECLPE
jgi:diaminohydroxyphosphoribosylaminopyrimidine deaminase/5-amino-6-(5-phosphoribosylamino)uracil reductase